MPMLNKSFPYKNSYQVSLLNIDVTILSEDLFHWLADNVGKRGENWEYEWESSTRNQINTMTDRFFFKNKDDAFKFKLIW